MQKKTGKIFHIILTLMVTCYGSIVYANNKGTKEILKGDSLFQQKHYVEACQYYEMAFRKDSTFSNRSLMRMAFIYESLGDYTQTLYYLDQHYKKLPERPVLKKMEEIALRFNLKGYEYNDWQYFLSYYDRFRVQVLWSVAGLCLIYLIYLWIKKRHHNPIGFRPSLLLLLLAGLYFLNNYSVHGDQKIVRNNGALMSNPSAASDIIGRIEKGHRVRVLGKEDVWYRIDWQGKPQYIHQNNLF